MCFLGIKSAWMKVKVFALCKTYQTYFLGIKSAWMKVKVFESNVSNVFFRYQKCLDARPAAGRDQEVPNSRNSIGGCRIFTCI